MHRVTESLNFQLTFVVALPRLRPFRRTRRRLAGGPIGLIHGPQGPGIMRMLIG